MGYLTKAQLDKYGFKSLGTNVQISDKASIYDADKIEIDDNSRIDDYCVVSGRVSIGKNVHIAPLCLVAGGEKGVFIDDFCGLAYNVQVFTQSDDYTGSALTNATIPSKYKAEKKSSVFLKRHAIVGAGSIVLPGVTIEEGCSIGAMTLVNKSTQSWGIYFGIPAKRLKDRKKDMLLLEEQFLKEKNDTF